MGGLDDDIVRGGPGSDELYGEDGDDYLLPGSGVDFVDGGYGEDAIVVLHACELVEGKVFDGGAGADVLVLPEGVSLEDALASGVAVENIEGVVELQAGVHGVSDCDPDLGWMAIQGG